jgi:hypothetical protein
LVLRLVQGFSSGTKPLLGSGVFRLREQDAHILWAADASKPSEQVFLALAQLPVHQNQTLCPVVAGIDGLGDDLSMSGQPLVEGFGGKALGLVSEHDNNFVFDIQTRVVVVVEFRRGDASKYRTEWRTLHEGHIAVPGLGEVRRAFIAPQDHELRVAFIFQRLQKRMDLERAESASKFLMLFPRDLLIAKEQHLILKKCLAHDVKAVLVQIRDMDPFDFSAERAGNSID